MRDRDRVRRFHGVTLIVLAVLAVPPTASALLDVPANHQFPYRDAPGSILVNGDFNKCNYQQSYRVTFGPPETRGETTCPPWFAKLGYPMDGPVRSRVTSLYDGRSEIQGYLEIFYTKRDGVLLIEQPLAYDDTVVYTDPKEVRFRLRTVEGDALVGFRITVPDRNDDGKPELVPAQKSPFWHNSTITTEWRNFSLKFIPNSGDVLNAAFEISPLTSDGAIIEIDNFELLGAHVRPKRTS